MIYSVILLYNMHYNILTKHVMFQKDILLMYYVNRVNKNDISHNVITLNMLDDLFNAAQ